MPATTKERTVTLASLNNGVPLVLITVGENRDGYKLESISSDFGIAFRMGKFTVEGNSEKYDVLLDGVRSSCTCAGHTYRGRCRHVDALTKLQQLGRLPTAKREPVEDDGRWEPEDL